MTAHTQSAADFSQHSEVAYAASDLLQAVLGEAGVHSKTSVGAHQLPKKCIGRAELRGWGSLVALKLFLYY